MRPYVRAANITWSGWDLSDVKEMNFSPDEFETFALQPGDVLLNEGSGSAKEVGKPAVWNGEIQGACFQNTLLRVRPEGYLPHLLRYSILHIALSGGFVDNAKGISIFHIGKAGLARTVIPVPPVDEQPQLLQALDATFSRADRLETEAARARALLDRLESAVLGKAFRGELVAQNPTDEPASVLLERIRLQRAEASDHPRPRRNRKPEPTPMIPKPLSARDRLLEDIRNWPASGMRYEEVAKRMSLPHDEMRDALFELLSGSEPVLRQVFDKTDEQMLLCRIAA